MYGEFDEEGQDMASRKEGKYFTMVGFSVLSP
jgi:hypothetical protein